MLKEIIDIIKSKTDNVLKKYQTLKKEIQKKTLKHENFFNLKKLYFNKEKMSESNNSNKNDNQNDISPIINPFQNILGISHITTKTQKEYGNENLSSLQQDINISRSHSGHPAYTGGYVIEEKFKEEQKVMEILVEPVSVDMQTTTKMLNELSNLMNNFSLKVHEQQELTTISKNKICN